MRKIQNEEEDEREQVREDRPPGVLPRPLESNSTPFSWEVLELDLGLVARVVDLDRRFLAVTWLVSVASIERPLVEDDVADARWRRLDLVDQLAVRETLGLSDRGSRVCDAR